MEEQHGSSTLFGEMLGKTAVWSLLLQFMWIRCTWVPAGELGLQYIDAASRDSVAPALFFGETLGKTAVWSLLLQFM